MPKYMFRAECDTDVAYFLHIFPGEELVRANMVEIEPPLPDLKVMIETNTYTAEEILDCMRQVEDSHVMIQTLAPYDQYTGERDYSRV